MKRWTDKASGMKHTMISLDPLRDEQLHKVIDAKLAELRQDPANAKVPFEQLKVWPSWRPSAPRPARWVSPRS